VVTAIGRLVKVCIKTLLRRGESLEGAPISQHQLDCGFSEHTDAGHTHKPNTECMHLLEQHSTKKPRTTVVLACFSTTLGCVHLQAHQLLSNHHLPPL
jgi:hypothetical protein